jgi:hypothetical protein
MPVVPVRLARSLAPGGQVVFDVIVGESTGRPEGRPCVISSRSFLARWRSLAAVAFLAPGAGASDREIAALCFGPIVGRPCQVEGSDGSDAILI